VREALSLRRRRVGTDSIPARTWASRPSREEVCQRRTTRSRALPGRLYFWQREFGGNLNAIGKTISRNGHSFPISGITPSSFFGVQPGQRFDVALPLCADNVFAKDGKGRAFNKMAYWLTPIARLKPGWSVERASMHMANLSATIFRETVPAEYRPDFVKSYRKNKLKAISASAGVSALRRQFANPLWILMAITGSVLLIACANLANLLLARQRTRAGNRGAAGGGSFTAASDDATAYREPSAGGSGNCAWNVSRAGLEPDPGGVP
jgi:hypothetical protein